MQLDIEYFQKLFTISYIYITEILPKKVCVNKRKYIETFLVTLDIDLNIYSIKKQEIPLPK